MRKPPLHKEIRTIEEILVDGVDSAVVLPVGTLNSPGTDTNLGRLRLLRQYAQIATTSDAQTLKNAVDWHKRYGYPGLLGKDYRDGDLASPIEITIPIAESAKNLKALLRLYNMWQLKDEEGLCRLLVSVQETESVGAVLDRRADRDDQIARENQDTKRRLIAYLLKREKGKAKYVRTISTQGIKAEFVRKNSQSESRLRFQGIEYAYYSDQIDDWCVFVPTRIEPLYAEIADASSRVLLYAHDQLTKAANIMLRGVQPRLVSDVTTGESRFEYFRCDWHIIGKSFAELICKKGLSLRDCIVCGRDITDLIKSAKKCNSCAKMKRS